MASRRQSIIQIIKDLGIQTNKKKDALTTGLPWEDADVTYEGTLEEIITCVTDSMLSEDYLAVHLEAVSQIAWPHDARIEAVVQRSLNPEQ